jgi:hypothetical protein
MSENKTIKDAKQTILEQITGAPLEYVKGLAEAYATLVNAESIEFQLEDQRKMFEEMYPKGAQQEQK